MALTDFLFQDKAPTPLPAGSDTSVAFPLWLQGSLYNTIGAATNLAQQPYEAFPGPTVATPSNATQSAWDMALRNVGNYQPALSGALSSAQAGSAPINKADISAFLNPYQDYVTGALNRNLMNKVLPNVQDRFVSAGQSRSPQEAQVTRDAIYDNQSAVGTSLASGYNAAMDNLLRSRGQQIQGGAVQGQLGALQSQLGATDIGQVAAAGQSQDIVNQQNLDAARSRFEAEQQWPYQQLGFLSNIIHGLPTQQAGYTEQKVGTEYLPGQLPYSSPFNTFLGALNSGGGAGGNWLGGLGALGSGLGMKDGGDVVVPMRKKKRQPQLRGALSMKAA